MKARPILDRSPARSVVITSMMVFLLKVFGKNLTLVGMGKCIACLDLDCRCMLMWLFTSPCKRLLRIAEQIWVSLQISLIGFPFCSSTWKLLST